MEQNIEFELPTLSDYDEFLNFLHSDERIGSHSELHMLRQIFGKERKKVCNAQLGG